LNHTVIEEIKYVLVKKPSLRELYDKSEVFIRKQVEQSPFNPN